MTAGINAVGYTECSAVHSDTVFCGGGGYVILAKRFLQLFLGIALCDVKLRQTSEVSVLPYEKVKAAFSEQLAEQKRTVKRHVFDMKRVGGYHNCGDTELLQLLETLSYKFFIRAPEAVRLDIIYLNSVSCQGTDSGAEGREVYKGLTASDVHRICSRLTEKTGDPLGDFLGDVILRAIGGGCYYAVLAGGGTYVIYYYSGI